jgi:hypothetical protein
MTHTIEVTALPDDESDDVVYTVEGPHDGTCVVWYPCEMELVSIKVRAGLPGTPPLGQRYPKPMMSRFRQGRCPHEVTDSEDDEGEYVAHGIEHQRIDGEWMTMSDRCAALESDSASEELAEIAREHGLGRHEVEIDYYGDGDWNASYVAPTEN